jgi:hypothetical protein
MEWILHESTAHHYERRARLPLDNVKALALNIETNKNKEAKMMKVKCMPEQTKKTNEDLVDSIDVRIL